MKSPKTTTSIAALLAFCLALSFPALVSARELDGAIGACLKAWGDHPFGENPQFRTLETSVKVFGIGGVATDTQPTRSPTLVLIDPSVNVLGGSTIELMNPNGWYCLRTTISILGKVNVRAHCKAHLASTSAGTTVLGNSRENRNVKDLTVTFIGSVAVERPCS